MTTTAKQLIARYNRSTGNFADNLREMGADDIAQSYTMPLAEAQKVVDHIAFLEMSVFDYFRKTLGDDPKDNSFRKLLCGSGCGAHCVRAIDAAAALFAICGEAKPVNAMQREAVLAMINQTIEVFFHG